MSKKLINFTVAVLMAVITTVIFAQDALAAPGDMLSGDEQAITQSLEYPELGGGPSLTQPAFQVNVNGEASDTIRIVVIMTVLTLLPTILMMMTSFVRIIIVFSLLRNAVGVQQSPPNQVLIGLALALTFFIMRPVIDDVNQNAYKPYSEGQISTVEFVETASVPIKGFMLEHTRADDLDTFYSISNRERPEDPMDASMDVVIPAFLLSEIKRAFMIGFLLYIPFLIIDLVVSSALMSMGMMMLPPITISLPFKLMLFVLVDGWGLLIKALVSTYM